MASTSGFALKAAVGVGIVALLAAFAVQAQSRGELLYQTHCIGCHTTKMHWRDKRAATDWAGVAIQVANWQNANSLSWNQQDVVAVARYLNDSFYHYEVLPPSPAASTGRAGK